MTQQLRLPYESPPATVDAPVTAPTESGVVAVAPETRDQRRSRRHRTVRARTISTKRMTRRELELGRLLYPPDEEPALERPKTRADCKGGVRPCPFVSCKHHLYLDVSAKTGAIKLNFPDLEPWQLEESCALDVADRDGTTLENVGRIMNLTRERIRQVEVKALAKLHAVDEMFALREHYGDCRPGTKRRLPLLRDDDEREENGKRHEDAEAGDEIDPDEFASSELDDDGS